MPPVLCVVGRPGSGSQAVVEGLVRELTAKGVRVATAVEAAQALALEPLSPAAAGYMAAGSEMTIVRAPGSVASVRRVDDEPSLDELVWEMRDDYDLVLADGFRRSSYLKLEVHRAEDGDELLCHKNELLAIAGDKPPGLDVPAFAVDDFVAHGGPGPPPLPDAGAGRGRHPLHRWRAPAAGAVRAQDRRQHRVGNGAPAEGRRRPEERGRGREDDAARSAPRSGRTRRWAASSAPARCRRAP